MRGGISMDKIMNRLIEAAYDGTLVIWTLNVIFVILIMALKGI